MPATSDTPPSLPGLAMHEKLGEGGMSVVWRATDLSSGLSVAVKVLKSEFAQSKEDLELFASESRTMEKITHEGIVKSFGLFSHEGRLYYVMEFVDGYSFAQLLARKRHLPESDCLLICESVAVALDYAWNNFGIVHCDIKPDNLMINTEGVVKITDLGLAHTFHFIKDGQIDVPDHITGTPAYISPEQIYGDVELDCRADIYSLAATLYHLSTGRVLFPGIDTEATMRAHCDEKSQAPSPLELNPSLSQGFAQLLEVMLVKNRDYRLRTWRDVFAMCRQVEEGAVFKLRPSAAISPSSIRLADG